MRNKQDLNTVITVLFLIVLFWPSSGQAGDVPESRVKRSPARSLKGEDKPTSDIIRMPRKIVNPCTEGKGNGLQTEYYDDKKIFLETNCVEGRKEGLSKKYYPNGRLWREGHYVKGQLEGTVKEYYPSGTLRLEENYKNGQLNGLRKTYYETGQVASEQQYVDGKAQGSLQDYDINGSIITPAIVDENSIRQGYPDVNKKESSPTQGDSGMTRVLKTEDSSAPIPKYEPYLKQVPVR